ncbi:DMT family transporter [Cohnella nanjingensis]|uniref:DMT family transporter n=1 Tax=Cohnella nanjingensis TaxID=1387779 RepID=A0A7X0RV13_9BACL|nr:DMT family transporter [Cohnella nanjingensis]MBB6674061.1 DMT family transporter [Cohnella nanjingensis]
MRPFKADMLMLLVTLFWGSSYLFMKMGLGDLGEFNLIALRFGFAFLIAAAFFAKRLRTTDFRTIRYAALLGFLLFGVIGCVLFGLRFTTTSNAGFLISLTVIFVPLLSFVFLRKKISKRMLAGVVLAIVGIGLITLRLPFSVNPGDALCALGALCYAVHILITGHATKGTDTLNLGIWQLGFAGAYGLAFSCLFETPTLPGSTKGWIAVVVLSVFCSALGYILQTVVQQYTSPTRLGLIFALEPVFAALFGLLFENEYLSMAGYAGGALVLLGVVVSEWRPKRAEPSRSRIRPARKDRHHPIGCARIQENEVSVQ